VDFCARDGCNDINNALCSHRATITNLQSRLDQLTTSHTLMKEELALTKLALEKEQEENRILRGCTQSESMPLV
jgi:hypothetical protein